MKRHPTWTTCVLCSLLGVFIGFAISGWNQNEPPSQDPTSAKVVEEPQPEAIPVEEEPVVLPLKGPGRGIGYMSMLQSGEAPHNSFQEEQINQYSPQAPGTYRIYWGEHTLYVGHSENIRIALLDHFDGSSLQSTCIWHSIRLRQGKPHFYYEQVQEESERSRMARNWFRKHVPGCAG